MRTVHIILIVLLLTLGVLPANAATTRHKYHAGTVSYLGNNQVVLESGTYTLVPEVKVVLITKESNGAHYERKGSLSDVSTGKRVSLKAIGRMVSEIVVER